MTVLILGSTGSGKSAYAEKLIARLSSGARYYIATMIPYGEEGAERVEKHRRQRETLEFTTVEKPFCVSGISVPRDASILLEDVSNLLGNALFGGVCGGSEDDVFEDIKYLCEKCRVSVLVSISGLNSQSEYDDETCCYIDALNRLNQRLHVLADIVITMRGGVPVYTKGDDDALV
jgi:adenosylcobinamide kinase/adenosylcobinamide-phosphate guanylyltransferase